VVAEPPPRAAVPFDEQAEVEALKAQLADVPGRLVYSGGESRERDGYFSSRPDGSDERRLTEDGGYPWSLAINGSRLAYDKRDQQAFRNYAVAVDLDNGERREIDGGTDPSVSPSGRMVAYWTGFYDEGWTLNVLDLQGGDQRELYHGGGIGPVEPGWSPDEEHIAFFKEYPEEERYQLVVVDVNGGPITVLADSQSELSPSPRIAWSPDGKSVAFDDDVVRIASVGGGPTEDLGEGDSVSWSPDGRFLAVRGGGLILYELENQRAERLTSDIAGAVEYPPAWSPDGEWLAYVGDDGTLRVLNVASGGIVSLPIEGDEVHWVPDSG
jgi:Tol biopolymer transport system component